MSPGTGLPVKSPPVLASMLLFQPVAVWASGMPQVGSVPFSYSVTPVQPLNMYW